MSTISFAETSPSSFVAATLVLVASAFVSASVGCNAVTGIDRYHPEEDFYSDGDGGSGGDSTGEAGEAGEAGDTRVGTSPPPSDSSSEVDVGEAGVADVAVDSGQNAAEADAPREADAAIDCVRRPKGTTCVLDSDCCTGSCSVPSMGCYVDDAAVASGSAAAVCTGYKCVWSGCDRLPC